MELDSKRLRERRKLSQQQIRIRNCDRRLTVIFGKLLSRIFANHKRLLTKRFVCVCARARARVCVYFEARCVALILTDACK